MKDCTNMIYVALFLVWHGIACTALRRCSGEGKGRYTILIALELDGICNDVSICILAGAFVCVRI
jgi:hypothetical protein